MKQEFAIRAVDWVAHPVPCPVAGQYLEWYNPRADAWGGAMVFSWTADLDKAMKFPAASLAISKWQEPLVDEHNVPRQRSEAPGADGTEKGAERPLTAFSIEIITIEQAKSETEGVVVFEIPRQPEEIK